ncbi:MULTISPECIES: ATPase, T2SS/T4P/T4SS family [unclassified Paraburkholderia]|uniref:ATPase, T2SS/T4P/T4SS family n=1 Tax=unclassified Paraburkholderia TaxID=2615204 RepID=UPI002AB11D4B|nr:MULTISPECIES: ATPase, T2SS/T4P/T4SS family [unclassified Paraburkholderia]
MTNFFTRSVSRVTAQLAGDEDRPAAAASPAGGQRTLRATGDPTAQNAERLPSLPEGLGPYVVYHSVSARPFGRVAIDMGVVTPAQLQVLLEEQGRTGRSVEELAEQTGLLDETELDLVRQAQRMDVHVDVRHAATAAFLTWIADLRRFGVRPEVHRLSADELEALRIAQRVQSVEDENGLATLMEARRMFTEAIALGATDFVLLVRETHAEVQVRVKGDYRVVNEYTRRPEEGEALARAIYTGLATVKDATYNPREFQDAQIHGSTFPRTSLESIRIIRGPHYPTESCSFLIARLQYGQEPANGDAPREVGRVLTLRTPKPPTGQFKVRGYTPLQHDLCEQLVRLPSGVVLATGPTGSGKTTTLYQLMRYQAQLFPEARQITIEDPPEYPLPWAITLDANGKDFREMVRMTLRMDPDIIQLAEIRKADEAVACLQAAETGHFVWSTLHVMDAFRVMPRLAGLDEERLAMSKTCDHELIVAMVAQRIVPVLCKACRRPLDESRESLPEYMLRALSTWGDTSGIHLRGPGCKECGDTGVTDREAVAEIVLSDEELMEGLVKLGFVEARRRHRARPGSDRSLLANAMERVLSGQFSPLDVHRHVHRLESAEHHNFS